MLEIGQKNNKIINISLLLFLIFGVFLFGIISFVVGKNFDLLLNKFGNSPSNFNNKAIDPVINNSANIEEKRVVVDEESAVINTVKNSSESVVSIVISKDVQKYKTITTNPFGDNFDLFGFGGITQQVPTGQTEKREIGGGSGFIISEDGLILTNKHVVDDSTASYSVVLNNGKTYDLEVLARDSFNDVAICKIKDLKDKIRPLNFGNSDNIQLGQTVIAIGNALAEYKNTVTKGIVSGIGRKITAGSNYQRSSETLEDIIQTDTAINPGNSGGPLLDLSGNVIGINTAVSSEGQNIGFAIPINSVKDVVDSVKKTGKIVRPYIGVRYIQLNEIVAKQNNLPYNYGVAVLRGQNVGDLAIIKDGPADKAGLKENDIILEFNGIQLDSDHPLAKEIAKLKPNDKAKLKIYRNSKVLDLEITLGEKEDK